MALELSCLATLLSLELEGSREGILYDEIYMGRLAQWLERATDNRVVAGSNPAEAVWKLWQFPLPHFASKCP